MMTRMIDGASRVYKTRAVYHTGSLSEQLTGRRQSTDRVTTTVKLASCLHRISFLGV